MVTKKQYLFIEAFLIALFIFSFGMLVGVFIENARVNLVESNFAQLETEMLDVKLFSSLIDLVDCEVVVKENMGFADRIFWEAKTLDKFEESSELTDSIRTQHKKYDLLRAMVWVNSIDIKKRCNSDYHNIVYLYEYKDPSLAKKAKQTVISNLLSDVKEKLGEDVLLISIAADNDLPSVDLLLKKYNITELPTILIDEEIKITDPKSMEDIEMYLG